MGIAGWDWMGLGRARWDWMGTDGAEMKGKGAKVGKFKYCTYP